jgi:capsular polysaccharide biosynthesis protein
MIEQNNSESISFKEILKFFKRNFIIIGIISILGGIIGAIFSGPSFITPLYKSNVVLYATQVNSISKPLMSTNPSEKQDVLAWGEEEDAERLLQVLQSDYVFDRLGKKFNLLEHYEIDPSKPFSSTLLSKKMRSRITFRRTQLLSVEISVLDKDPKLASEMANEIIALADTFKNNIQKERALEALKIVENEYISRDKFISSLTDSLSKLGNLGIYDYEQQSAALTEAYSYAVSRNDQRMLSEVNRMQGLLGKYGPVQKSLIDKLQNASEMQIKLKEKLDLIKTDAENTLPASFVINRAYPAEKKSYPVRSLIVLISALIGFGVSTVGLAIVESFKK